jgi:hypothetical protein
MRHVLIGAAALAAATFAGVAPGHAEYWQGHGTWCIQPPIGGGSWGCYYYSQRQCEATRMYGRGGCVPSPAEYWIKRGFTIDPAAMPDYAKGRRQEAAESGRRR